MNKLLLLFAAVAFVACTNNKQQNNANLLPYYNTADFKPQWLQNNDSNSVKQIHRIANFNFTDQTGNSFSSNHVAGKIYVADFFFTSCPGICKN